MSRANRIRQPALLSLCLCLIGSTRAEGQSLPNPGRLIVHESFEDTSLASRGWYDGVHLEIVADPTAPDGAHVNQWLWPRAGAINPRGGSARLHLPPMEDRGFELTSSVDRNFEVFVDYVAESIADAPDICNRHWREQVCNLGFGHVTLDFIGKLETYEKDLQNLFEVQGERAFLERSKSWRRQFNTSAKTDVSISDATRRKILRVYARDCEAFGY